MSADLPLTGDELAAISARARVADAGLFTRSDAVSHLAGRVLAEDVPRLVAEVKRLQATVQRVEAVLGDVDSHIKWTHDTFAPARFLRAALDGTEPT